MKTLLLIDGYSVMHRAYYALPELSTKGGLPTNAVYGFFTMLSKAIIDFQPTHLIVAFDTPVATFRKKMYDKYQIQRPKAPDGFKAQIPLIKELLDSAGIARVQKEGFEADDVIATAARRFRPDFDRILILTGDRDMLQLVDEKTIVIAPLKGISSSILYTADKVREKYGLQPNQIPDLKSLMGDASDNYGGAKGIGPKTATKILAEFKHVEQVLENLDKVEPVRIRELIRTHQEHVKLSKQLAVLDTGVEIGLHLEQCRLQPFKPDMKMRLEELELHSLVNRFFGSNDKKEKAESMVKNPDGQESLF